MRNPLFIINLVVTVKAFFSHLNPFCSFDLSRWWQHKGFGIESRTDFDFLHEVIREKLPYYIYKDMREKFPSASRSEQSLAQLLFRLGNYIHPSDVLYFGNPSDINRYALSHTKTKRDSSVVAIFVQGEPDKDIHSSLPLASLIVVTDIKDINKSLWQTILEHQHSITFDDRNLGIAIIDRKRFAEHYSI